MSSQAKVGWLAGWLIVSAVYQFRPALSAHEFSAIVCLQEIETTTTMSSEKNGLLMNQASGGNAPVHCSRANLPWSIAYGEPLDEEGAAIKTTNGSICMRRTAQTACHSCLALTSVAIDAGSQGRETKTPVDVGTPICQAANQNERNSHTLPALIVRFESPLHSRSPSSVSLQVLFSLYSRHF